MRNVTTIILRLALINALAISTGTLATASASAETVPVFAFCHNFGGASSGHGSYEDAHCEKLKLGELYGIAYADTETSLLLCLWELKPLFLFREDHCATHSPGKVGEFEKQLITTAGTPLLLGLPINAAVLKGKLSGAKIEISCKNGKFETQPLEGGKSSGGRLEYTTCEVVGSTKCTVTEPIVATFTDQLEGDKEDKFQGAGAEELFTSIEFLNKPNQTCSLNAMSFPVKGLQVCAGGAGINEFKLLQELECKVTGSKLKLGPEPAEYQNNVSVTAQSKEAWTVLLIEP